MATSNPSLPSQVKGVLVSSTGGPEVLQYKTDLPLPSPTPTQVLVQNEIIGVNFIDTYFRSGLYPSPKPEILGREGAGRVVSLGSSIEANKYGYNVGDRVVWRGTGGYAEYTAVSAEKASPIPDEISSEVACAVILQGLTALTLVEEAYPVQRGEWVHVTAASGGTGGLLLLALRAKGARALAVVGTRGKAQAARDLGAEVVLVEDELGDDGIRKAVMEHTNGEGVSVVFDSVGKVTFERSFGLVKRKGSMVSYGSASGAVEPFTVSRLSANNVKLLRPTSDRYLVTREEIDKYTTQLWENLIKNKWPIRIHEVYPLSEVARAHTDLEGRKTQGKLLLKP